jgi:hypothetical protein
MLGGPLATMESSALRLRLEDSDRQRWVRKNGYIWSDGLQGEGVHRAGLLENTGVELLEWRSSPGAATPIIYLRLNIRQKEYQTNSTVKHELCYWMSNKPRITSDFSKLQQIPKFTDNQYMYTHSFRRCYTRFNAQPNYMHIQIFVKTTCKCSSAKQQHR